MDRMRESIFAILGDLSGNAFLDLFSGSGIIGIEAASRGAEPVVLVEGDRGKRQVLLENISFVEAAIRVRLVPVERFLASARERFDYVFLDPPFRYARKEVLIRLAGERVLRRPGGTLLIHRPKEDELPASIGRLVRRDSRSYGRSIVDFYGFEVSGP